jgi:histidine triad (HIT) family protein
MTSIFTKIINNEIPSTKLYEDEKCIVILDISPSNKGHALVIPKKEQETLVDTDDNILQHLILIAKKVAKKQIEVLGCQGYNILINNKPASGQEVPHLHIHVIPRYENDGHKFNFNHKSYQDNEMKEFGDRLKLE